MPLEVRTPFSRSAAQRGSEAGTWRKRLLPVGKIEYKGRVLEFDKRYLEGLAQSYKASAYDQVPFQIADDKNTHTNDPERFRGEITGMDVQNDGLWITMKPTPAGNALLETNPKLGVSARIVEDYARSDGQYYPVAIQHVLGTLDPRVTGLGAWERTDLSNSGFEADMLIDLSAAEFAGEAQEGGTITMPELNIDQSARLARLLELDPDRLNAVMDSLGAGSGGTDDLSEDDLVTLIETMPEDEFASLGTEFGIEPEPVLAGAGAGLSNDGYGMSEIDLANYRLAENERQLSILQGQHDRTSYEAEKQVLFRRHNVPPFITELARPLLEGSGHTVELSNGEGAVDAGLIVRRVLQEFGQVCRDLGLESPVELGTAMDEPDMTQHAEQHRSDMVSAFRSQVGI